MVRPMANSPPNRVRNGTPRTIRSAPRSAASSTMAAPTSRAWSRTGSRVCLDSSATASAESRTCWTVSERLAMSVSRGSVQSISTTWTAMSSALASLACSATSLTTRASLGLPLRAMTARLKAGVWVSDMGGGHDTTGVAGLRPLVLVRAMVGVEVVLLLAPVRHVHHDRVRAPEQHGPQPLGRLVVEDPLPPRARHVLGDHHERDRLQLARGPRGVEHVEVGEQRTGERAVRRLDDDEGHPGDGPLEFGAQARRQLRVVGDVDRPDVVADRAGDVDGLDDGPVEARDRDDRALLAMEGV